MRKNQLTIIFTCFLSAVLFVTSAIAQSGKLVPVDVSEFCVTPEQNAVLRWKASEEPTAEQLAFTIFDVYGKQTSTAAARFHDGVVSAGVTLSQGYWEIAFDATGDRFGVISLPAAEEPLDDFFAIDAALSWLVKGDDLREGMIKLAKRSGIGLMRERFRMSGVAPEEGRFDFETQNRYSTLRETYKKHGVEVLELSHDAPEWMGRRKVYPKDLAKYADAMGAVAKQWQDGWGAIEIWNEPDIFFGGNLPADQYVAIVRAAAYRLRADGCKTPIIGGVTAHCNEDWIMLAMRNKLHEFIDIFSFHTYDRAPSVETLIEKYHDLTRDLPLWLTECGRPWKKGPGRPPVEQDLESVTDIVMKGVESRCCGIDRYFPFVLPYYEENDNNFGMLDRQGTPLRSMAGYAQLIRVLAHTEYVGDLHPDAFSVVGDDDPAVMRARVFKSRNGESVIAIYTGSMKPTSIKTNFPVQRAESVTGEICEPGTITNGLIYLFADVAENRINRDTKAMTLSQKVKTPPKTWKDVKQSLPPVVTVLDYEQEFITPSSSGYRIKWATPDESEKPYRDVTMQLYNLADSDQAGEIYENMPNGPGPFFDDHGAFYLEGKESTTVCQSYGYQPCVDYALYHYDISAGECKDEEKWKAEGGYCFYIRVEGTPTMEGLHKEYPEAKPLPIAAEHWQPSLGANGQMKIETQDRDANDTEGPQNFVRFDVTFGEGDRWCYPRLTLPGDWSLQENGGIFARIRCSGEMQPRVFLFEQSTGSGYLSDDGKTVCPADGNWHVVHIPFRSFTYNGSTPVDPNGKLDLDDVKTLSFGFNSKEEHATLELGDVFVYSAGEKK